MHDDRRRDSALRCVECGSAPFVFDANESPARRRTRWRAVNGIYDSGRRRPSDATHLRGSVITRMEHGTWRGTITCIAPIPFWPGSRTPVSLRRRYRAPLRCAHARHGVRRWSTRPSCRVPIGVGVDVDQAALEKYHAREPTPATPRGLLSASVRSGVFESCINVYNLEHLIHLDFALEEAMARPEDEGECSCQCRRKGDWRGRAGAG